MKQNAHSCYLDLVGGRHEAFSIVLIGNQIADYFLPQPSPRGRAA
jgi:hypothetical protein